MSQDWISKFFENRSWLGLVQYSQTSGLTVANTPIALETYTYADFATIDTTYRRYIVISDLHSANVSSGAYGGSRWLVNPLASTPEEKIVLDSDPIWFDTYAAFLAAITLANHPGLRVRCGDVGSGLVPLVVKETSTPGTYRVVPDGGDCILVDKVYGTVASPTMTIGAGLTTNEQFDIGAPIIPANLLKVGDRMRLVGTFARRGTTTTLTRFIVCLGTAGAVTEARLFENSFTGSALNPWQSNFDFSISVASSSIFVTNNASNIGEHSATTVKRDVTTGINIASDMELSAWVTTKDTADSIDLLDLQLRWSAVL